MAKPAQHSDYSAAENRQQSGLLQETITGDWLATCHPQAQQRDTGTKTRAQVAAAA